MLSNQANCRQPKKRLWIKTNAIGRGAWERDIRLENITHLTSREVKERAIRSARQKLGQEN